jgi:hypothetical protein
MDYGRFSIDNAVIFLVDNNIIFIHELSERWLCLSNVRNRKLCQSHNKTSIRAIFR